MDAVRQNDALLSGAEKNNFAQNALARFAALALMAALAASNVHATKESHSSENRGAVPAATLVLPEIDELAALERAYLSVSPTDNLPSKYHGEAPDYLPRIYDEKASDESSVVYRHEGLESVSFARPSLEVSRKILEAGSLDDMEAAAKPFFTSLGISLYMTEPHPTIKDDVVELGQEDLEDTRTTLLATLNEMAVTPREVIKFANVADVVLARDIRSGKQGAAGIAYMSSQPGIIAIDVSGDDRYGHAYTWNHELGHHLAHQLDADTGRAFSREFAKLNMPGFRYKDQLLLQDAVDLAIQNMQRKRALAETDIISDYSAESVAEDEAESYTSLWAGQLAPDVQDMSYGKPLGKKRVLWIESLDQAVPGFRAYLIGLSTTAIYAHEKVPVNQQDYEEAQKIYPR